MIRIQDSRIVEITQVTIREIEELLRLHSSSMLHIETAHELLENPRHGSLWGMKGADNRVLVTVRIFYTSEPMIQSNLIVHDP